MSKNRGEPEPQRLALLALAAELNFAEISRSHSGKRGFIVSSFPSPT